ncbi:MAG: GspE/PulE family protein [Candidatus Colwellbacteria bacterium]|nr:GspE/PulE family protein [Candidatus Colwellbacteria bacterium]
MKFSQQPIEDKIKNIRREAEEREAKRRAVEERLPYLDLRRQAIDRSALELIAEDLARTARAIPFRKDKKRIGLAALTSKSGELAKLLLFLEEKKLEPDISITSLSGLEEGWREYSSVRVEDRGEIVSEIRLAEGVLQSKANIKSVVIASDDLTDIDPDTSTTDALVKILADAIALKTSDVHFESGKTTAPVRFRIDGILYEVAKLPADIHRRITGRIKLLANLKLNIKDRPQDGRFTIRRQKGDVDTRVSVMPAEYGESVVLRILDPQTVNLGLADLGLRADDEAIVLEAVKQPNGMILVTGPTGSGKTTSLYAFLRTGNSPGIKTVTIEDPIEYHLEGIEQTQVSPEDGYTFASGLRSALRQDPDMILVGEIRDKETADTAINAALTGHLVFSTLHTNSALGAVPRLIDLGVKPGSIAPAINLIMAQRLVRRLCEKCRSAVTADESMARRIDAFYARLPAKAVPRDKKRNLYREVGCSECEGGFRGRVGIFEMFSMDSSFDEIVGQGISEAKMKNYAHKQGMVSMQEDGILKVLAGITTLDEVEKVTGSIKWPKGEVE